MTRLNLLLLAALLGSCLYLIQTTYETRRLFSELERAKTLSTRLEVDHKRLEAERQAQATHLRVEKVARDRLAMRTATPAVTQYVASDGTPVAAAPSASAPPQGVR